MIPSLVEEYIDIAYKNAIMSVDSRASAIAVLHDLGISVESEFGEFYSKYRGGFIGPKPISELLKIISEGIPTIPNQTEYVRNRYNIPAQYLAITTDEGEGMYLYNKSDQAVYDLDIGYLDEFLNNKLPARWSSFNEFLVWYFDSPEPD